MILKTNKLVLLLCIFPLLTALEINAQGNYFRICLGAYKTPDITAFIQAQEVGQVYGETDQELTRVFVGGYDDINLANATLDKLKTLGYKDAIIKSLPIGTSKVRTVQIASYTSTKTIDWHRLFKIRGIQILLQNDVIRICTGIYNTDAEARTAMNDMKEQGFTDAFIKSISPVYLHKMTPIEIVFSFLTLRTSTSVEEESGSALYEALLYKVDKTKLANKDDLTNYEAFKKQTPELSRYAKVTPNQPDQDVAIFLQCMSDTMPIVLKFPLVSRELLALKTMPDTIKRSQEEEMLTRMLLINLSMRFNNPTFRKDLNLYRYISLLGALARLEKHYQTAGVSAEIAAQLADYTFLETCKPYIFEDK